MLPSGIRDNRDRGSAGEHLAGLLEAKSHLSIVSAYFTIHAYGELKEELEQIDNLHFLFGEPSFLGSLGREQRESREFSLTEQGLKLVNQLRQSRLAKDCAGWIRRKVKIRSVREKFLHGKMYHIKNGEDSHALLGSSNFTAAGLGLNEGGNVELNLVVDSRRDRDDLRAWFDEWWSDETATEDVKDAVLQELEALYSDQKPEFIYYLTLFHIFKDYLDSEKDAASDIEQIALPDTDVWEKLYAFQKDGAKAAINKIKRFNGCILADSVGLGKTFTALAVIKYFELRNERVLVLCPKRLERNWTIYRDNTEYNPFIDDRFRYDVLSHTDLSREGGHADRMDLATLSWGNYDLLVIDESHNFRNNNASRDPQPGEMQPDDKPRKTRYEKLIEDVIKAGINTKVLLLSATPVNNNIFDLRNQISLIAGGDVFRDSHADAVFREHLDLQSVKETTRIAQQRFTQWSMNPQRDSRDLLESIGADFFKLLDGLSIARSRRQIMQHYKEDMDRLGKFPERPPPRSIYSPIDQKDEYFSFEQINEKIKKLKLALYHPSGYLLPDLPTEIRKRYEGRVLGGFTQERREKILIGMMRVNFLKRLESSVHSFCLTLHRTIGKIDELLQKFDEFEEHRQENQEIDYDEFLDPDRLDDPELESSEFVVGKKRKFRLADIDIPKWRRAVSGDRETLGHLWARTEKIGPERDEKLARLRKEIFRKLNHPTTTNKYGRENRKVLIFTAFADTAGYLYDNLHQEIQGMGTHTALLRGDGGNRTTMSTGRDYDNILTNFSPISKGKEKPEDPPSEQIDVLIATDCISEGQNLQDCDLLINYDIHWNPVKIIQRFGRIDRIGSLNEEVHLINFWPTEDLESYLNLQRRVEDRMALVDVSATQTDNVLQIPETKEGSDGQITDVSPPYEAEGPEVGKLVENDLRFRDEQLKRIKEEILDLEDFEDNIALSDFSLDEFRSDLLQFLEERRKELEAANPGLYAVVPPVEDNPAAKPGVVFCLRHLRQSGSDDAKVINPLGCYYLIYVLDDGTVRFAFTQPKQALSLLRSVARGHKEALRDLCRQFDEATQDGRDMERYDTLIKKALKSIKYTFDQRNLGNLFSGRGGKLASTSQVPSESEEEYELLT